MSETADSPQNGVTTSPYDPLLNKLYNSQRPPVELVPGVGLSAVVNAAWLPNDAKAMLSESWIPVAEEPEEPTPDEEPGPPPLSFEPAAAEYNVMAKRLSRSLPLWEWNSLTIKVKELEKDIEKEKDDKMKEAKNNQLEEARANLAETEAQLADLRASFAEEPISLVPWMQTLFALADAGLSTFDVSGRFYPYTNLRALFSSENNSSFFEGPETVLGAFKRRYERERGQGRIQLLMKLVPNHFQDGYVPEEVVEKMVERMRSSLFGAEPPEALDLVQLHWHDVHAHDALPTLKALQAATEDKLELMNEETGEMSITEPKKVKAIGLIDFPARSILSAIQAGVPLVTLQIPFSIADRSFYPSLEMAREYNIKVFARDGLMGGLISEKYLDVAPPSTTGPADPDLDEVAHVLELVNNYGGWDKTQALLKQIKAVADKHGVKMQTVALRWQIDQGTFPVATMRWADQCWNQFGHFHWNEARPGIDPQLFHVESFLDEEDMQKLNMLGH